MPNVRGSMPDRIHANLYGQSKPLQMHRLRSLREKLSGRSNQNSN